MSDAAPLPLTVLIVDDHFVVRSGLAASLELDDTIRIVGEAERSEEVVAAYRQHRPRVVLLDLQLPGQGGIAAMAALRAHDANARVLIFSTFARDDEIQAALDAGALGFLQKSASREELLAALRSVAQGRRHLSPEIARRLNALRLGPAITPREREILALIARGRANKEIAAVLDISEDTVKRHVSHILEKLDVNDRAQATAEAIRRGIVKMEG
ncbi:MAG: response regulator transcription factor [Verrucomicrobia bacterium]|nr:response regulator transcription factor [Verrucomicrobiota bacterium]